MLIATQKLLLAVAVVLGVGAFPVHAGTVQRVSVTTGGAPGNGTSTSTAGRAVSTDGRVIAFVSGATNLVAGDTNGVNDVFVHDRATGTTTRVSVSSAGVQANASSLAPAISADGQVVVFVTGASTLVAGDTNNASDVFVHDRATGTTTRVSVGPGGVQATGASIDPAVSADGMVVAFRSSASNLVAGDENAQPDVFVHDRTTGTTSCVSVSSNGDQGNAASSTPVLSGDGRLVVFASNAVNLVANDFNAITDVFLHDRATAKTTRVSLRANGLEANGASLTPAISADGSTVAWQGSGSNFVPGDTNAAADVFVADLATLAVTRVSVAAGGVQANGASAAPALSADGHLVAYQSAATNLVPGDTNATGDVFVHERATGGVMRMSIGPGGVQANGASSAPALSGDGSATAFTSTATNLVTPGTGSHVYVEAATCGDGMADPGEACDDGNPTSGDGCDGNCTPTGCGNGIVTAGEDCDDGNLVDGDGCTATCSLRRCGNGVVEGDEGCDDGNLVDDDGCDGNCTPTGCGNGIVTAGETCEDGNAVDGDGCDGNCTLTACGNGVATAGEACDDGNLTDGDGCDRDCTPTGCGNGIVTAGEACDDGNLVEGDGCEDDCRPTLCLGGVAPRRPSIVVEPDKLTFRGSLPFAAGMPPGWRATERGAQVLVEDIGGGAALLDMTAATGAVPPAGELPVCSEPSGGWKTRGRSPAEVYRSCGGGAGRVTVKFVDQRAKRGEIDFVVTLKHVELSPPVGPLRGTIVLGAMPEAGLRGECGAVTFAATACALEGDAFSCR